MFKKSHRTADVDMKMAARGERPHELLGQTSAEEDEEKINKNDKSGGKNLKQIRSKGFF